MNLQTIAWNAPGFGVQPPAGWDSLPLPDQQRTLISWLRPLVAEQHLLITAHPFVHRLLAELDPPAPAPVAPVPRPTYTRPGARNLIYHVCPLKENDIWRQNVRQLGLRMDVFNHKRVIAVAEGPGLHPLAEVKAEFAKWCNVVQSNPISHFAGEATIFKALPNDPILREVATFLPLLYDVCGYSIHEMTFYAHTKGNSTTDSRRGSEYWRNAMYHHLLDDFERVADLMVDHVAVGTHLMHWPPDRLSPFPTMLAVPHRWMFAGTFFWFRSDAVFKNPDWRNVPHDRYGAEAWLGGLFPAEQAASVFQPWDRDQYPTPSPYDPTLYANPIVDDYPTL